MNIAAAAIGIAMMMAYVGTLIWAINAWSFTLISLFVFAILLFDFVRSMILGGNKGAEY
jgi:hypothetical protein